MCTRAQSFRLKPTTPSSATAELNDLPSPHGQRSHADAPALWYAPNMRSAIWIGIFIGSTIGGLIPELWGDDMLSYSGVLFSGIGAFVALWLGS